MQANVALASQDQRTVDRTTNAIGGARDEVAGVQESISVQTKPPSAVADKVGKTLRQLVISTPPLMKNNAKGVVIKSISRKKTKSGGVAYIAVAVDVVKHRIPPKHKCYILGKNVDNKTVTRNKQRVMVFCDCLTGDTKVLTAEGWKTLYELAEPLQLNHYPIKYLVDGKKYKGTAPFRKGTSKVWKVTLTNGEEFSATQDHRFLVWEGERQKSNSQKVWKELKDLEVGDNMVVSKFEHDFSSVVKNSPEFNDWFALGVLLGDGTFDPSSATNLMCPEVQLYKKDALEIGQMLAESSTLGNERKATRSKSIRQAFNHRMLELIARTMRGGKNSMTAIKSDTQFIGMLSGLLVTDGTVTKAGLSVSGSRDYLQEFFDYSVKCGLAPKLYLSRRSGSTTNLGTAKSDMHMLVFNSVDTVVLSKLLWLTKDKTARLQKFMEKADGRIHDPKTKIKSIEHCGMRDVYDITVPKVHRFVINGGVVAHNCENYIFYWEYANWKNGCGKIINNNGEPSTMTNPHDRPGLCKHLIALSEVLADRGL